MPSKKLEMHFKDEGGKNFSLSLDQPRQDISASEVGLAMDNIIQKDIFFTKGGSIVESVKARIVTRTVEDIEI